MWWRFGFSFVQETFPSTSSSSFPYVGEQSLFLFHGRATVWSSKISARTSIPMSCLVEASTLDPLPEPWYRKQVKNNQMFLKQFQSYMAGGKDFICSLLRCTSVNVWCPRKLGLQTPGLDGWSPFYFWALIIRASLLASSAYSLPFLGSCFSHSVSSVWNVFFLLLLIQIRA